jgi:uncharacterized membrane protein
MSSTGCSPRGGGGPGASREAASRSPRGPAESPSGWPSAPRGSSFNVGPSYDADTFGRFSEGIARFLGTGRFLAGQSVLVLIWIGFNSFGFIYHWDPYPFILLNLAFSTQAAYAAPLILLAQNRQDDRDRASIERDREVAARTQADTEFLARELSAVRLAMADVVTNEDLEEKMSKLVRMIAAVQVQLGAPDPRAGAHSELVHGED